MWQLWDWEFDIHYNYYYNWHDHWVVSDACDPSRAAAAASLHAPFGRGLIPQLDYPIQRCQLRQGARLLIFNTSNNTQSAALWWSMAAIYDFFMYKMLMIWIIFKRNFHERNNNDNNHKLTMKIKKKRIANDKKY